MLEDKILISVVIDGKIIWVHFIAAVRHTCSMHSLATCQQLSITIRPYGDRKLVACIHTALEVLSLLSYSTYKFSTVPANSKVKI